MPELYLDLDRRLRVRRMADTLRTALDLGGDPVLEHFTFTERDGDPVAWTAADTVEATVQLTGHIGDRWKVTAEIAVSGQRAPRAAWEITATYTGEEPCETGFDISWNARVEDAEPFVPGIFYGENRPAGRGGYPRWTPDPSDDEADASDPAASASWRFRTDRTMNPVAMLRGRDVTAAIITPDRFSHGASGMGFEASRERARLSVHFPFREEPIRYSPYDAGIGAPEPPALQVSPGDTVVMTFEIYAGRSGWRSLVRDLYQDNPDDLAPWMPSARAAELAAFGLLQWHYDPERHVLYETSGFDLYFRHAPRPWDRRHMHISWNGGMPYALALARHGSKVGNEEMVEAGLSVIDLVAREALAPSGVFYPQWTIEEGWTGGWKSDESLPPVAQSRTIGEAVWFLLLALCATEKWATGKRLHSWAKAAQSNLDFALKVQREDGSFGTYYNLETGAVEEWEGAGGLMWIPALLMGARYRNAAGAGFPRSEEYMQAALKAGDFYASLVRRERLMGAPEDVPYGVSSEDGYNALIAMFHLYEETGDEKWMELAEQAADYTLSFRMSYNATFPETTLLGKYDFRTKGGDIASPSNQHLHLYGYICLPEMLRLWRLTGDDYLFDRARDHVFCFRQFIAREDGDFNARKGMVSEQWFHTDWTHPKGYILPLAHSWCNGWIIWVEDWLRSWGTLFVQPQTRKLYLLEAVEVIDEDWAGGTVTLRNPWEQDVDVYVVNMLTEARKVLHLPAGETHMYQL